MTAQCNGPPDGIERGVSYGEHQLDLAAMRGDQITEWRRRRQNELESGLHSRAIMDMIEATKRDPDEVLEVLWAFIFGANQPETGVEKVRELMRTLIENTLQFEEKRGDWK